MITANCLGWHILIKRFLYLFTVLDLVTSSCLIFFLLSWASCFVLQNCRKCCEAVRISTEVLGNWNFSEVWLALEHLSLFHHGDRVFCSQDDSTSVFPGFKQASHNIVSLFSLVNVSIPWPFMIGGRSLQSQRFQSQLNMVQGQGDCGVLVFQWLRMSSQQYINDASQTPELRISNWQNIRMNNCKSTQQGSHTPPSPWQPPAFLVVRNLTL